MKAVNLLPPDLRSGSKGTAPAVSAGMEDAGGPGPFVVLGALALCVAALAGYVLASNVVKDREAKLADVKARSEATTRQVEALKPYADFESIAKERVATVNDLATSRFDWEQALRDLARTLPADVTLSQLGGTVSSKSTSGATGNSLIRGALDVPAIELQGCTSGQTNVARLMSRLRNIDGVTRVSLAKSDKETQTARSVPRTATAPVTGTPTGACGAGGRPTFNVVVFFESTSGAAPAIVADATAAPAAPAADKGTSENTPPANNGQPASGTPGAGASNTPASSTTNAQGQAK
jgi:Tfp pilus assembly protein PilN